MECCSDYGVKNVSDKRGSYKLLQARRTLSFPNSKKPGVEMELYFVGESKIIEEKQWDLFYYRNLKNRIQTISSYPLHKTSISNKSASNTKFIIQLTSGFDYFLNFD
ncbi:hypothetical protein YDYSY3_38970 [Paenibacillus chitinolyticus]|nr:hypothetical protein YDYSY3_38970 [Paenibacillus chitinolyticus]